MSGKILKSLILEALESADLQHACENAAQEVSDAITSLKKDSVIIPDTHEGMQQVSGFFTLLRSKFPEIEFNNPYKPQQRYKKK